MVTSKEGIRMKATMKYDARVDRAFQDKRLANFVADKGTGKILSIEICDKLQVVRDKLMMIWYRRILWRRFISHPNTCSSSLKKR